MSILYNLYNFIPSLYLKRCVTNYLKSRKMGSTSSLLREIYKKDFGITIGYGSYGCFNASNIPSNVIFGNYCSIAEGVKIFRANHPINSFTTHPLFYNPIMGYVKKDSLSRPNLSVGHDVWIGANAIILPTVKNIGNGAVIGAGSIVTKDVPAYSIMAGNPAKEIRKRFNINQINYLESTNWWELSYSDLIRVYESLKQGLLNLTD